MMEHYLDIKDGVRLYVSVHPDCRIEIEIERIRVDGWCYMTAVEARKLRTVLTRSIKEAEAKALEAMK